MFRSLGAEVRSTGVRLDRFDSYPRRRLRPPASSWWSWTDEMVSQIFASWNRVVSWLRQLEVIRAAAWRRMTARPISR